VLIDSLLTEERLKEQRMTSPYFAVTFTVD